MDEQMVRNHAARLDELSTQLERALTNGASLTFIGGISARIRVRTIELTRAVGTNAT